MEKLAEGFDCECGKYNAYSMYIYAHWDTEFIFTCECGKRYDICMGVVDEIEPYIESSK